MDGTFPSTDRDRLWCGLLCDLVATWPGLPMLAYLDALVIARDPPKYQCLLIGEDRSRFLNLALAGPPAIRAGGNDHIPWRDMLRLLTLLEAIRIQPGDTAAPGTRFNARRGAFPPCDDELVRLIHKAAERVRELIEVAKHS